MSRPGGTRPPRVLMLSDVYFPRVNGVSTSIEITRRHLARIDVETALLAPDYAKPTPAEDILRVPGRPVPFDPEDRLMSWSKALRGGRALLAEGYDIIHVHTPFVAHYLGLRLAREFDLPLIETYHTFFEEYAGQYLRFLPAALLRFLARRISCRQANATSTLVVPSTAMIEVLRNYGVKRPLHLLPTGIEMEDFACGEGAAFRERLGIAPDRRVLLHVGRIAHEKNIPFLLSVMDRLRRQMPELLLLIAGDGPARAELQGRVHALAMERNVRFLGYLDRDGDLQSCYRSADLFVFSSRTETQGLVLLEAMACGLPVVSLAEMGTRDLLSKGRGAVVAPEDADVFAKAVADLLSDPERLARLGREAQALAAGYAASAQARQLLTLYRQTLEAHRSRAAQGVGVPAEP